MTKTETNTEEFNKGHIAEYMFATMFAASFFAGETDLAAKYKELKKSMGEQFVKNPNNSRIAVTKKNVTLVFSLTKNTLKTSNLAKNSAEYFFAMDSVSSADENVMTLKQYEAQIQTYVSKYKKKHPTLYKTTEKILVDSEGMVDATAAKADITITVGTRKLSFSLKTKSETVHSTTLSAKGVASIFDTLFGPKRYKEEHFLEAMANPKKGLPAVYNKVYNDVTTSGVVKANIKPNFIKGLKNIITKKDPSFKLIKITEKGYSELMFTPDYEKVANLFDYEIKIDKSTRYFYINIVNIKSKFAAVRTDNEKMMVEVGTAINILANTGLRPFIKGIVKVSKGKNVYNGFEMKTGAVPSNVYQLTNTLKSVKYITEKQKIKKSYYFILTDAGNAFVNMVKDTLNIKN